MSNEKERNEQINFILYVISNLEKLTICNIAMAIIEFYFAGLLFDNILAFKILCNEFA